MKGVKKMSFAERLRKKRVEAGLSQTELATHAGIHIRTVQNYESGYRYPNSLAITVKLAAALNTTSEYLLGEEGEYIIDAAEKGGTKAKRDIKALVSELSGLFAGGELSEEDRDAAMQALSEAYWIAKKESKKYTPKKHLKNK
jgi:transcriptional regulator with XRE-family HTH domain